MPSFSSKAKLDQNIKQQQTKTVEAKGESDPDVIRTRNLLIWSQTRYRCATESAEESRAKKFIYNRYNLGVLSAVEQ